MDSVCLQKAPWQSLDTETITDTANRINAATEDGPRLCHCLHEGEMQLQNCYTSNDGRQRTTAIFNELRGCIAPTLQIIEGIVTSLPPVGFEQHATTLKQETARLQDDCNPLENLQRVVDIALSTLLLARGCVMALPLHPPTKQQAEMVYIRWMIRRDIPEVVAIENRSFECPWSDEDFIRRLRERNTIATVAEHDNRIVGYSMHTLLDKLITVHRFAVRPDMRHHGIGSSIFRKLSGKLYEERRNCLLCCVNETNLDGQLFLRKRNCRVIAVDKNPNPDDAHEPVYLMRHTCKAENGGNQQSENPMRAA